MTNWKAMQVPGTSAEKGAAKSYVRPGDTLTRGLSMGSWGGYQEKARSSGSSSGKAKIKIVRPPPGGWTTEALNKATRS